MLCSYTIRELVHEGDKADFQKLLNELSAMGYTAVEAASYDQGKGTIYGFTPEDYKAAVEAAGMESLSAHIGKPLSDEELNSGDYSQSLAWWDKTIADQKKSRSVIYSNALDEHPLNLETAQSLLRLLQRSRQKMRSSRHQVRIP